MATIQPFCMTSGYLACDNNTPRLEVEFTWITIIASLCMGIGAALVFVYAAKKDYFHNIEDTKYQVFWTDIEESGLSPREERKDVEEEKQP